MPRPSKLTAEVSAKIVESIRAGNYARVAAEAAGIDERTFYRWMADERAEFCQFRQSVTRASAEAEAAAVLVIRAAMSDDWRAALEYLKRRHADRWADRSKTELTGQGGQPVEIRFSYDPEAT